MKDTIEWGVEVRLVGSDEYIRYYGWFESEEQAVECLRRALRESSPWANARKIKRISRVEVVE